MNDKADRELFDDALRERLGGLVRLESPERLAELSSPGALHRLAEVDVLITGWGAPVISADVLAAAPRLRAIFHAGGSVKNHISQACWDRGILVTSASDANAIPVAEFTLGTILLEGKRAHTYADRYRRHRDGNDSWRDAMPPAINYGGTVGLVGFSRVGKRVAALLRPFDLTVLVSDPHASTAEIVETGAEHVGLDELLRRSEVVSLHAPELPTTRRLLDRRRLSLMRDDSILINTARGSLVDTEALIEECRSGRLRAVLDVTEPEPLPAASPLYDLPNVELTPHIAGSMHAETHRMTESILDEIGRYLRAEPLRHRVNGGALEFSA